MNRIAIDETFSDAAVEAIMRARFARYELRIVQSAVTIVVLDTGSRVHRFSGITRRAAMLSAMEFAP
tara:strand:+ start:90 stop:290 length:201 start_codon:yes stop_codon:yes gene_type:complete